MEFIHPESPHFGISCTEVFLHQLKHTVFQETIYPREVDVMENNQFCRCDITTKLKTIICNEAILMTFFMENIYVLTIVITILINLTRITV